MSRDRLEQPYAARSERLGRAAALALWDLLNQGFQRSADGESSQFSLDRVVAAEALLYAVDGYPEWLDKSHRDNLLDRLDGLLDVDPEEQDPSLPGGDQASAMRLLRHAVVVEALVALLMWTPREEDLGKAAREALEKLRPDVQACLTHRAITLAALVLAETDVRVHSFVTFRVLRALRRAGARLGVFDAAGASTGKDTGPLSGRSPLAATGAPANRERDVQAIQARHVEATGDDANRVELQLEQHGEQPAATAGLAAPVGDDVRNLVAPAQQVEEAVLAVWENLRPRLEKRLARHQLGLMSSGDIVELAFDAATAAVLGPAAARYANAAAQASIDLPDVATGWAEGRVVAAEVKEAFRRSLAVPVAEVFSATAETLLVPRAEDGAAPRTAEAVRAALGRGLDLLDNTLVEPSVPHGPAGWADELFGDQNPSTWPTAAALRLSVASSDVMGQHAREEVFGRYETVRTSGGDWPEWLEWEKYWRNNEPDCKAQLLRYIHEQIVEPRLKAGPNPDCACGSSGPDDRGR